MSKRIKKPRNPIGKQNKTFEYPEELSTQSEIRRKQKILTSADVSRIEAEFAASLDPQSRARLETGQISDPSYIMENITRDRERSRDGDKDFDRILGPDVTYNVPPPSQDLMAEFAQGQNRVQAQRQAALESSFDKYGFDPEGDYPLQAIVRRGGGNNYPLPAEYQRRYVGGGGGGGGLGSMFEKIPGSEQAAVTTSNALALVANDITSVPMKNKAIRKASNLRNNGFVRLSESGKRQLWNAATQGLTAGVLLTGMGAGLAYAARGLQEDLGNNMILGFKPKNGSLSFGTRDGSWYGPNPFSKNAAKVLGNGLRDAMTQPTFEGARLRAARSLIKSYNRFRMALRQYNGMVGTTDPVSQQEYTTKLQNQAQANKAGLGFVLGAIPYQKVNNEGWNEVQYKRNVRLRDLASKPNSGLVKKYEAFNARLTKMRGR